jgi:hypothetical protein
MGNLSTQDEHSGRQIQVVVLENVDVIHSMILDDQRTFPKEIAEALGISQEGVGCIILDTYDPETKESKEWGTVVPCIQSHQARCWHLSSGIKMEFCL